MRGRYNTTSWLLLTVAITLLALSGVTDAQYYSYGRNNAAAAAQYRQQQQQQYSDYEDERTNRRALGDNVFNFIVILIVVAVIIGIVWGIVACSKNCADEQVEHGKCKKKHRHSSSSSSHSSSSSDD